MELEFQKIAHVPYLPGYASNPLVAPFPIGKISGIRCCLTLISSQDSIELFRLTQLQLSFKPLQSTETGKNGS